MGFETPKDLTPEEIAEIQKARSLSDAEFLKGGAVYKADAEGKTTLDVTPDQVESVRSEMEKTLPKSADINKKEEVDEMGNKAEKLDMLMEQARSDVEEFEKVLKDFKKEPKEIIKKLEEAKKYKERYWIGSSKYGSPRWSVTQEGTREEGWNKLQDDISEQRKGRLDLLIDKLRHFEKDVWVPNGSLDKPKFFAEEIGDKKTQSAANKLREKAGYLLDESRDLIAKNENVKDEGDGKKVESVV